MRKTCLILTLAATLAGCSTLREPRPGPKPVEVQILAVNDFHGALEPPGFSVPVVGPGGAEMQVPAGGAAHLASALAELRKGRANSITVAAGDLTGGSPFASSQFLDEPAVLALNAIGLEVNAVGNHEFDRGVAELKRLQEGGCAQHTARAPCRVDAAFPGARYRYLAANVRQADGSTLFPATYLKRFGRGADTVTIGFIGLTLKTTPTLVVPSAVASLSFADEAETINAAVPKLRDQGADAVVVLIHQGAEIAGNFADKSCPGLDGDILPILEKLTPGVDLVVSGHTHNAYVCESGGVGKPMLTSAGARGMMVTDIRLTIDPVANRVIARRGDNVVVQSVGYTGPRGAVPVVAALPVYPPEPAVQSIVARYVAAADPIAKRVVGRLTAPVSRDRDVNGESALGSLVADAQAKAAGAEIAFMNSYGLRASLTPAADGSVTYGQLYAVQPFGNVLQVKGMTAAQIRTVLEQQFASGTNTAESPNMLQVSRGFAFTYDLRRPAGERVTAITLNGKPLDAARVYRVAVSNFLAAGGDNFTGFIAGTELGGATEDIDALEAWFANAAVTPPAAGRITRVDAPAKAEAPKS